MFERFDFNVLDSPSFKEDAVREEIIAPILKRLGYQASGQTRVERSKSLVHPFVYIGTRRHPVNIIPDYTLWQDEKALLVLDAKRPTEDILRSHHVEQAYSYAIHPEVRCKHYALCNGRDITVFQVDEVAPIFVCPIQDCEARWDEFEKYLTPRYLLNPILRKFQPDMGVAIMKLGFRPTTEFVFPACRIDFMGRVNDDLYTASSSCDFAGPHLASFDFTPNLLEPIISCLAWPLAEQVKGALSRSPYTAHLDLMVEVDWTTELGPMTQGRDDWFVPFIVKEVLASRFNRSPPEHDPDDIPDHEFRLRRAFEALQARTK